MLNFNYCHLCMCQIFNKTHKKQVANALATADCKAKTNLISADDQHQCPTKDQDPA